jgi:hypothetical protein
VAACHFPLQGYEPPAAAAAAGAAGTGSGVGGAVAD